MIYYGHIEATRHDIKRMLRKTCFICNVKEMYSSTHDFLKLRWRKYKIELFAVILHWEMETAGWHGFLRNKPGRSLLHKTSYFAPIVKTQAHLYNHCWQFIKNMMVFVSLHSLSPPGKTVTLWQLWWMSCAFFFLAVTERGGSSAFQRRIRFIVDYLF